MALYLLPKLVFMPATVVALRYSQVLHLLHLLCKDVIARVWNLSSLNIFI